MPRPALPSRCIEMFLAAHAPGTSACGIGLVVLGYAGTTRIYDIRRAVAVEGFGGDIVHAAARAIAWALVGRAAEAVTVHVPGAFLARALERLARGKGKPASVALLAGVAGRMEVVLDRIDRPMTPRMAEAIGMARHAAATARIRLPADGP